jgi:5-methylthioadenosine/S-adenosylhomocysteine deaminase
MLVQGGQVLDPRGTLEPADVLVEGDRIAAVGLGLDVPPGADLLDATGCLVLPGLINAHTHAHNNLARGRADNWSLEDLLNHGPALNGNRSPEDTYLSAAIGALEMLKTGCTAAYDLVMGVPAPTDEHLEAVVRAYNDVGLRAVIAPSVADLIFYRTVPGLFDLLPSDLRGTVEAMEVAPTDELVALTDRAIRRWNGAANGRIRIAVSPTIPSQCSDELLIGFKRLVREHGVGLHTHLVESKVQVMHGLDRWSRTVVARLAKLDLLGSWFVGAHAIWLTDDDIARLAEVGAAVAHNPASNLRLGNGIAPVREMLDRGLAVGLGTDGSVCSDNLDMFEAMRFASLVSNVRLPYDQRRWIDARAAWQPATLGSARALGLADDIGAIAPGRKADLVLLRSDGSFLRPRNDPINALVYAETGANVETVLVDGRVVLERGQVVGVDEAWLYAQAQEAADRLRERNAEAWTLAEALTPYLSEACRAAAARPYPINRYASPIPDA